MGEEMGKIFKMGDFSPIGGGSESPEMLNEACVKMCSNERISANILVAKLYR